MLKGFQALKSDFALLIKNIEDKDVLKGIMGLSYIEVQQKLISHVLNFLVHLKYTIIYNTC